MLSVGGIRLALARSFVEALTQNGVKRIGVGPLQVPVATMRATHGEKYPYSKPWPYESKKFTLMNEFFDSTTGRMNENSKVITVEGNVGVGKTEFAKRLAEEFDLKVFAATPDDDCFTFNDFDIRLCNDLLPKGCQAYDLKRFLSDGNPESGHVGRLQLQWFYAKFVTYCNALTHLLNTGQGVVIVRSVFGDSVFPEALRKMGWLTKNFTNHYHNQRNASICELLKPHLTIYLDAPLDVLKQRIKKRNDPREVNSRNLTDKYLQTIDAVYRQNYLPKMRESGEVLEIDWTEPADDMDMDVIAEEIALLELKSEDNEDPKYQDWRMLDEEEYCHLRRVYNSIEYIDSWFAGPVPYDCPEILFSQDEAAAFDKVVREHPALKYDHGWAPEFGHNVLLKI